MSVIYLIIATIIYGLYAGLTYSHWRQSQWFIPLGLLLGSASNIFWLLLSRRLENHSQQFFWALLWDSCIVATFILVPMIFFGFRLTPLGYVGVTLTVAGLLLTKATLV